MTFASHVNHFLENNNWQTFYRQFKNNYFKAITTAGTDYWNVHTQGLELADIDNRDKENTEILDLGTWFGLLPYMLKQYGFAKVDASECLVHSQGLRDLFENILWPAFNLDPYELHVLPLQEFTLPKQYDIITCFQSNLFWKTKEVIHFTHKSPISNDMWEVIDKTGTAHTFFTVYKKHEWNFFINNLRKFLKPGGKAIIQPSPFVYDVIDGYAAEYEYLKPFIVEGPKDNKINGSKAFYVVIEK